MSISQPIFTHKIYNNDIHTLQDSKKLILTQKKTSKALWYNYIYIIYKMGEYIVVILHINGSRAIFLIFCNNQDT